MREEGKKKKTHMGGDAEGEGEKILKQTSH